MLIGYMLINLFVHGYLLPCLNNPWVMYVPFRILFKSSSNLKLTLQVWHMDLTWSTYLLMCLKPLINPWIISISDQDHSRFFGCNSTPYLGSWIDSVCYIWFALWLSWFYLYLFFDIGTSFFWWVVHKVDILLTTSEIPTRLWEPSSSSPCG